VLLTAFAVWMWPQINAYTACESGANTNAEHQACSTQFTRGMATKIETRLGLPPGSIKIDPQQP
jgi:hypothetical protein